MVPTRFGNEFGVSLEVWVIGGATRGVTRGVGGGWTHSLFHVGIVLICLEGCVMLFYTM